jgi:hypothetical protein
MVSLSQEDGSTGVTSWSSPPSPATSPAIAVNTMTAHPATPHVCRGCPGLVIGPATNSEIRRAQQTAQTWALPATIIMATDCRPRLPSTPWVAVRQRHSHVGQRLTAPDFIQEKLEACNHHGQDATGAPYLVLGRYKNSTAVSCATGTTGQCSVRNLEDNRQRHLHRH